MYKEILSDVKKVKRESILAPTFVALEVIANSSIPFVMAYLIDEGIRANNFDLTWQIGLLLLVASAGALFFGYSAGKNAAKAATGFAAHLRSHMFLKIQTFSFRNIDYFSTSSLVTRMTTDVNFVQNAYQMMVRVAFRAPLMLLMSFFMILQINLELGLVFLATLPFLGGGLFLIIKFAHPIFVRSFKEYDVLNETVQENLHGIRTVKSYVREDYETKKFTERSTLLYKLFRKAERLVALNNPLMNLSLLITRILIFYKASQLIAYETMTTGQLASIMTYSMQILMSLMMLSMIFVMIIISKASLDRIGEVLVTQADLTSPANALTEINSGSVVFENVSFSYQAEQKRQVLSHVNLTFKAGETIGIIGGTGSSKTSLVQLIPRLYDVSQGAVFVDGHDVRKYDLTTLRDSVAMVLQNNTLFSGTIKENLRWGNPQATDEQLIEVCKTAQAHDFIMSFDQGYDTHIEQGGSNVSGGQKQRLTIARALLKDPKIIIFDDSTSAVDTKTDALLQASLKTAHQATTKIIIAQRLSSIMEADKIVVLDDGQVFAVGTHEELLKNCSIYQEIYASQQEGE